MTRGIIWSLKWILLTQRSRRGFLSSLVQAIFKEHVPELCKSSRFDACKLLNYIHLTFIPNAVIENRMLHGVAF